MSHQHSFDLPRLDPKAPDLDLLVSAAEELELALRPPSDQVPGAVHPRAGLAKGSATKRSALNPGCFRYPRARPAPAM